MLENTKFLITGGFDIDKALEPVTSAAGEICGYKLPDGRTVRLTMALEVEPVDGSAPMEYINSEAAMAALGFEGLDYGNTSFTPDPTGEQMEEQAQQAARPGEKG